MKIRHNIFETNSSSTHSFVLYNAKTDYIIPEITEDIVVIQCDSYGWGYDELKSWRSRAEYMATYAALYGGPETIKKFENELSDYLKVPVKIAMPKKNKYDYYDECIDHQSIDKATEMFENLKQTIFAKNGIIIISNDNQ